jgi:hypothetical protein
MKLILRYLIILFFFISFFCWSNEASSTDYADVLSAYNATSAGGTLTIPSGESTWNIGTGDYLTIEKAITIEGNGIGNTIINGNPSSATDTIFKIDPSSDVAIRITGIDFRFTTNDDGARCVFIHGSRTGDHVLSQIRIDHCRFHKGTRAVYVYGWVYGVADNNQFVNNNMSVSLTGDNNYSWERAIDAGTAYAFFVEDNTFTITNDADSEPNHLIYQQEGARSVVRYNTFDASSYTDGNAIFYDSHGNQKYYSEGEYFRGQPIIEIYENTFAMYDSYNPFIGGLRGGSILCYNNTLTSVGSPPYAISVTEEESWQTAFFDPLDDTWPAEDQINNSFFWGNTLNGDPVTSIHIQNENAEEFIQENRDYFMHAPQSSGGYEYYDDRQGAAGNGADGTLNWDGDHANAYYPYTAYTYPHPLREEGWEEGVNGPFASDLVMILSQLLAVPAIQFLIYSIGSVWIYAMIRAINKFL